MIDDELPIALGEGDPQRVRALIEAGAEIRYKDNNGYDALLDAVHGCNIVRDPRLLDLLSLLADNGVRPFRGFDPPQMANNAFECWIGPAPCCQRSHECVLIRESGSDYGKKWEGYVIERRGIVVKQYDVELLDPYVPIPARLANVARRNGDLSTAFKKYGKTIPRLKLTQHQRHPLDSRKLVKFFHWRIFYRDSGAFLELPPATSSSAALRRAATACLT
jgi:hypothetical protein